MASDGTASGRAPGRRASDLGFQWVTASPSPAMVERMEALYPDVVVVPVAELETEMAGWLQRAVLARSYQRWIPAEAMIREFRRAGISGAIVPISLANRCHIFQFEDPAARAMILGRPWLINGQVIGTEAWKPEFFPAEDSIPTAIVWMRLPSLPLEFWKEDFLRLIVEPVGELVRVDASTSAKNRGGYARVAVRVDLRRPLRPGTRIQGIQGPFWQQFVFECLEGICPQCGTIHLEGNCLQAAMAEGEVAAEGSVFGPWMSAIRQRKVVADPLMSGRSSSQSKPSPNSSKVSDSTPGSSSLGWQLPQKVARRRATGLVKNGVASQSDGKKEKSASASGFSPSRGARAGFPVTEKAKPKHAISEGLASILSNPLESRNPFASLDLDSDAGGQLECREAFSGPLKRARPEGSSAPRSFSSSEKRKGKGKLASSKSKLVIIPPSVREVAMVNSVQEVGSASAEDGGVIEGQGSAFLSLAHASRSVELGVGLEGLEASSLRIMEGGSLSAGSLSDSAMLEDQGGSVTPPDCK